MTNVVAPVTGKTSDETMSKKRGARDHGSAAGPDLSPAAAFDYGRLAELFPTRGRKPRRNPIGYKRFAKAADAIRFAIEDLPDDLLLGAFLQVEEERFGSDGIRRLYDSAEYPLKRRAVSKPPR